MEAPGGMYRVSRLGEEGQALMQNRSNGEKKTISRKWTDVGELKIREMGIRQNCKDLAARSRSRRRNYFREFVWAET